MTSMDRSPGGTPPGRARGARGPGMPGAWALAYVPIHVYWALTGSLRPFGELPGSLTDSQWRQANWAACFVITGAAVVSLALVQPWGRRLPRPILLGAPPVRRHPRRRPDDRPTRRSTRDARGQAPIVLEARRCSVRGRSQPPAGTPPPPDRWRSPPFADESGLRQAVEVLQPVVHEPASLRRAAARRAVSSRPPRHPRPRRHSRATSADSWTRRRSWVSWSEWSQPSRWSSPRLPERRERSSTLRPPGRSGRGPPVPGRHRRWRALALADTGDEPLQRRAEAESVARR